MSAELRRLLAEATPVECLEWTGARSPRGYGRMRHGGRTVQVHRLAWEIANGEPLGDRIAMHSCDNPPCFNPYHLKAGTVAENNRDMATKGRAANYATHHPPTHCPHGHEYTPANTRISGGSRYCRSCYRLRWHERKAVA